MGVRYEDMDRHDIPTAVAIGFTISVLSTFGHEVLGHGGACVLTGCDPVQFSSTYFVGNKAGLPAVQSGRSRSVERSSISSSAWRSSLFSG